MKQSIPFVDALSSSAFQQSPVIIKRDGKEVAFDAGRIGRAIEQAFRAVYQLRADEPVSEALHRQITQLTEQVVRWCLRHTQLSVEQVQDEVERVLMEAGEHAVARRYILYREERHRLRRQNQLHYRTKEGTLAPIPYEALKQRVQLAIEDIPFVDAEAIYAQAIRDFYPGIREEEIDHAFIFAARSLIERQPEYTYVAARLLLLKIYREVWDRPITQEEAFSQYQDAFQTYLARGLSAGLLTPELERFDVEKLAAAIQPARDLTFTYLGLQTLYDRYLLRQEDSVIELPQFLWMRVAMGLALREEEPERWAIAFYELLSSFRFVNSTPTLFNAGTRHAQLSSCYLTTVQDDLEHIFESIKDNALLSKWAGGLGNDWTPVRALGASIRGTGGKSQGVIPFLKIVNDTAVAVNQGGKRKGAVCAYLETWHLDIEEFLELRRNTGDERRRTHDMNTANWIPDLFMQRVQERGLWTLFSPDEVPDLHELYGQAFKERYEYYERLADAGKIKLFKRIPAVDLWRKMLSMLFETGHPWITFKDPSNIRSPQDHVGVVHSSNLCTEILLNTSPDEIAVCNLGSVNLVQHLDEKGSIDLEKLKDTVTTAIRMLDNVIDINFYPVPEARQANMRHRPIGLGLMGFQDALYRKGISYASEEAVVFADESMEAIAYFAIRASALLAKERGKYPSYRGSKWDRGYLPQDTLDLLEKERGEPIPVPRAGKLNWQPVRELVARYGMRNANVLAIAPTATIANIAGVSPSIEPTYRHLYVKSNLSGEFTQTNRYLIEALREAGIWDEEMLDDLKYFDGSIQEIARVPESLKKQFLTAFEIEPRWLIACAARRQKWIDMGQSLNLYIAHPSGRRLHEMYMEAWRMGLKTTYYLRSLGATQIEKSTLDINRRGLQPRWMQSESPSARVTVQRGSQCALDDPTCEACQ